MTEDLLIRLEKITVPEREPNSVIKEKILVLYKSWSFDRGWTAVLETFRDQLGEMLKYKSS